MYVVRRRVKWPGLAQDDQKIIERARPTIPTTIRIHPIVWMFTPFTAWFTANARIAPTATRKMLTPNPIFVASVRLGEDLAGDATGGEPIRVRLFLASTGCVQ